MVMNPALHDSISNYRLVERIGQGVACVHARVGRVDDSIAQLNEATRNVPGLVADGPRRDPDLEILHDHPEFIRMFGHAPDRT